MQVVELVRKLFRWNDQSGRNIIF